MDIMIHETKLMVGDEARTNEGWCFTSVANQKLQNQRHCKQTPTGQLSFIANYTT